MGTRGGKIFSRNSFLLAEQMLYPSALGSPLPWAGTHSKVPHFRVWLQGWVAHQGMGLPEFLVEC